MCGILGWATAQHEALDPRQFARALDTIRHRGPDDEGYLLFESASGRTTAHVGRDSAQELDLTPLPAGANGADVMLGHRRLSIIDLTVGGHQPMASHSGRYWITYNGEIYNHVELRAELERIGHRFCTTSDTEVLLSAIEEWGVGALQRLTGMFAFGMLDTQARELLLVRDYFGIKPLYFTLGNGRIVFASELKALFPLTTGPRAVEADELLQFLVAGERRSGRKTLFASIEQLPAAHLLRYDLRSGQMVEFRRFWSLAPTRLLDISFDDAVQAVRTGFHDSVRLHLRSDVPVGACLSGGLDSSAIVTTMQRLLPPDHTPLAFSFLANEERFSEERYVRMISGVRSFTTRPEASELRHEMVDLLRTQELPFDNLSPYAQYRVFKLAREQNVKVMLDGQGSDEIFGGYTSLIGARLTGLLASGRLTDAIRLACAIPTTLPGARLRTAATAIGRLLPSAAQRAVMHLARGGRYPPWLKGTWFRERGLTSAVRMHGRGCSALREELVHGIEEVTLPHLLRYEDRNSMRFSIESRVPFCNHVLAEFAAALPEDYLIAPDGTTKRVFREALAPQLPSAIVTREKLGFHSPDRLWLRYLRDWVELTLSGQTARDAAFLDLARARSTVLAALDGNGYWPPHAWRILCVVAWGDFFEVSWQH